MTNRKTLTIILLVALIFFFQEAWQLFEGVQYDVDPFPLIDYSLDIQWYVKWLGAKTADILKAVIIVMLSRLYFDIKTVAMGYLIFTILDLMMYCFVCSSYSYTPVYLITGVFTAVYSYRRYWKGMSREPKVQASVASKAEVSGGVKYINNYVPEANAPINL